MPLRACVLRSILCSVRHSRCSVSICWNSSWRRWEKVFTVTNLISLWSLEHLIPCPSKWKSLMFIAVYISCYYYCCVRTAVHIPWCQRTTFGSHLSFVLCAPGYPSPQVFKARIHLLNQLARPTPPPPSPALSLAFLELDGGPPAFRPELSYVLIFLWHGTFLLQSSN